MTEKSISSPLNQEESLEFASPSPQSLLDVQLFHRRGVSYRRTSFRWLGLFLQCSINIGQRFCFDNPQALQFYFTSDPLSLSSTEYNLFYSVYSFPNIVLPFFAGLIIDKLSIRFAILLFSSLLILGQSVFMFGGYLLSYWLMILGRFIFGLGGECMAVCQSCIIIKWFKQRELALALSLALGSNRIGSFLNSFLCPRLYQVNQSFTLPLFVGLVLCGYSFVCAFFLTIMDKEADKREGKISHVLIELEQEGKVIEERGKFEIFNKFGKVYWMLAAIFAIGYGSLLTLTGNANDLLCKVFGISSVEAGSYITLIYIISSICLPIIGIFIDKFGMRVYVLGLALLCFLAVHLLLAFIDISIKFIFLLPICICGIGFAFFGGSIWNTVSLLIPSESTGSSYGILVSLMNIIFVLSPILYGNIHDQSLEYRNGYFWSEIFLSLMIFVSLCILIFVGILAKELNKPTKKNDVISSIRVSMSYMSHG